MCPCEEEVVEEEEEEETTDHLIFQCKKLRNQRNEPIKQTNKHLWQLTYDECDTCQQLFTNFCKIRQIHTLYRSAMTLYYKR